MIVVHSELYYDAPTGEFGHAIRGTVLNQSFKTSNVTGVERFFTSINKSPQSASIILSIKVECAENYHGVFCNETDHHHNVTSKNNSQHNIIDESKKSCHCKAGSTDKGINIYIENN